MHRSFVAFLICLACSAIAQGLLVCSLTDPAPTKQVRTFTVYADQRQVGTYTQEIVTSANTVEVTATSSVHVKVLTYKYDYSYSGRETWLEGWNGLLVLHSLQSTANDDGVAITNQVARVKAGLTVNGKNVVAPELWTTTFWTLPDPSLRSKPVQLLNLENGQVGQVTLKLIGQENRSGRVCSHWQIAGSISADLWFDENERLVRRQMIRKGRNAVLELVSVR